MAPVPEEAPVGLCLTCRWSRTVTNRRGSVFYRCGRADSDPRFPRYPALPVRTCPGFAATNGDKKEGGAGP